VHLVEDVATRQRLLADAAASLSQERATETLPEGHQHLTALGLVEPQVIQSDAGSDFISGHFQQFCHSLNNWIQCRVGQVGGMGILERLNRTFKHEFIFRHEVNRLAKSQALLLHFL
jgi:putative transposase